MQKQFFGAEQEILLEANFDIDRAIILLPRMSANAHGESYAGLVRAAEDAGYACARLKLWEDLDEAMAFSYEMAFAKVDAAIAALKAIGFVDFALVGHSYGGAIALMYQHELVSQKILWTPAIGVAEGAGNFAEYKTTPIGEVGNPLSVTVGKELVGESKVTGIIHGSKDTTVPIQNSEQLAGLLGVEVVEVEEADHAFKDTFHRDKLHEITEGLLK